MFRLTIALFLVFGPHLAAEAVAGGGPESRYYLTAGNDDRNIRVRRSNDTATNQHFNLEYPIAVTGTVRTAGIVNEGRGAEYDSEFGYLGVDFELVAPAGAEFYDGTTDGVYFYAIDFFSGDVYRFKKNWKKPKKLFSVGGPGDFLAITYDPTNDSFWVARWDSDKVENYSRNGNFLSRFSVGHNFITCLALEHDRGILWIGNEEVPGVFEGYDRDGNLVASIDYGFDLNTLGGEFDLGAVAPVQSFNVTRGSLVSGNEGALRKRDNKVVSYDAANGSGGSQVSELEVKFTSAVADPGRLDLIVEHKISQSGGQARISIKNWDTGDFDVVHTENLGGAFKSMSAENLDGADYIRDDGLIIVRIRHTIADPNGTVRSQVNLAQVHVRK
jgi:hypothetical protein